MRCVKVLLAAAASMPLVSYAALGGAPLTSSTPTHSLLRAAAAPASSAVLPYTVREAHGSDGVTIREYVLPDNVVFALTWEGPVRPDMNALLGSYLPNFVSASEARARGTGPLVDHTNEFHIESAGHAGHFFGKAYVPRLVPVNVRVDDLL